MRPGPTDSMTRLHPTQLAIRFADSAAPRQRRAVTDASDLVHVEDVDAAGFVVHALAPTGRSTPARRARAIRSLEAHPHVEQVRSVFQDGGKRWFATQRVLVGLARGKRSSATGRVRQLIKDGARVVREQHGTALLELHSSQEIDDVLRRLAGIPGVEFVEPEFVVLGRHAHSTAPSAAWLAVNQVPMQLIDARSAWNAKVASTSVTIAVLDCGVMASHPDLKPSIAATFDATTGQKNQSPPPWDSHGTSCAGLAAGAHVKSAGVRGVADGCRLMGIRIGKTPTRLGTYVTKTSWLCRGIDWAWEQGADVLNMSYGGGPHSAAVVAALQRARTKGRDGKGTVLIASAGNGAPPRTPVEFPATLSWVFAVAATDNRDRPKRTATNQEPWVSASGPAVDIAAPGVGCYTTTVPDPTEGEDALYTSAFSGTSASTPLVAGAAALVLSANPSLTEEAVRRLLTATADKVRSVTYRRGRSNEVGAGRLNVGAAVRAALASRGT